MTARKDGLPRSDCKIAGHRVFVAEMMYLMGYTLEDIADFFDMKSTGALHGILKRHGVKMRRHGHYPGAKHPLWKGGRRVDDHGYVLVWCPDHPRSRKSYVKEHVLVFEEKIGRFLDPDEIVHHEDENPKNNNISNLRLFANNIEHNRYHALKRLRNSNGQFIST